MKYLKIILIAVVLMSASQAGNRLIVNDTTISSGDTVWVTIDMENDDGVVSFQFDLEFPETLIYSGVAELSERAVDHELYYSMIDGVSRVMALSNTLTTFTGNSGTLVTLGFTTSLEHGIFDFELINPILGDHNSENILTGYENGTITIEQIDYDGPVWHVSSTGLDSNSGYEESPFSTIQHGIDRSTDFDTVIVHPGIYFENINFNGKNVVVSSLQLTTNDTSYISSTIIDGGSSGSVVTIGSGETNACVLNGFVIRNGLSFGGDGLNDGYGGGIFINNYSSPILDNLIVEDNESNHEGGGILVDLSNPVIRNSIIRRNSSGGIAIIAMSNPLIEGCIVKGNTDSWGAGIKISGGGGSVEIRHTVICENIAELHGGGLYASGTVANPSTVDLVNVTIANNEAPTFGGGGILGTMESEINVVNTILWGNQPDQISQEHTSSIVNVYYSDIQNGFEGESNLNIDPQFDTEPGHEYYLTGNSPCIDTGDPDLDNDGYYWAVDFDDQDEDGTRLDIGAFSFFQEDLNPEDNSIAFDGIDDYVIVPNEYGPSNIGQNRTIAAWVRPEDLSPRPLSSGMTGEIAYAVALTQQITSTYSGAHWGGIGIELSENPRFMAIGYNGPPLYTAAAGIGIPLVGEWYHIALVFDGYDLRLFVNGLEEGSQSFTGFYPTSTGGDAALVIGSHLANQEFNYTFPGLIGNVQLWNRALQPSELRSLVSSAPSDSFDTDLIGHWALNEGSGTFVSDESGSEFATDGTLSGGSWSHLNSTPIDYRSRYNVAISGSNETGDGSEDFPFATIQYGINSSLNGDTVLVQPGTYTENINFIGKNISVGSLALTTNDTSYISQTIIDGSESGSVVTFSSSEDSTSILNGFTIRNGFALAGGGIYCDASSPSLINLKISENSASTLGGGIYSDHSGHPVVESSEVTNNTAGAGGGINCQNNAGITLANTLVNNNQAEYTGGGLDMHTGVLRANDCVFNNNVVQHQMTGYGGGLSLQGSTSDISLLNCQIQGNTAPNRGGGIYCGDANPTLTNVLITDNRITASGNYDGGSGIYNPGTGSFINVTIANNWAPNRGAIYGASGAVFTNSIIWHNTPSLSPSIVATYSNIEDNSIPGASNLNTDPLFIDMYNQDYHLSDSSPCIGSGTSAESPGMDLDGNIRPNPEGSAPDMGVYESPLSVRETGNTYFVSTTGSDTTFGGLIDPFSTISRGVEAAWNGDTVIVFPGVYEENLFISNMSIVLGSQMLLTGDTNYVNITKINGGIIFDEGVDSTALLSGFTIQNSTTGIACVGDPTLSYLRVQDHSNDGITFNGSDASLSHIRLTRNGRGIEGTDSELSLFDVIVNQNSTTEDGAGIYLIGCTAVMDSVEITDNLTTNGFGGGMYINSSTVALSRSIIDRNRSDSHDGGGIYFTTNSTITMENVSISENQANEFGGGLYVGRDINSSLIATNVRINNNVCNDYGAGIYIKGVNDFTLSHSWIQGNTTERRGGGIYCRDAHPELINVLISGNEVTGSGVDDGGGGIYLIESNSDPTLTNVTITNNTANAGGGVYRYDIGCDPTFLNCIIWNNTSGNFNTSNGVTITYSDIEGGFTGVGNINSIPLFADIYNSDYHLSDNSNCIGSGTSVGAPGLDLDGNIRPDPPGSAPDMGAYENPLSERISGNIYYVSTTGSDSAFGGPSDPFLTIQHGINASWNGDTLLVMPGIYEGNINFNGKSVVLASLLLTTGDTSYVSNTIIEGSIYVVSGEDSTAVLSGFTIQNSDVGILCTGDPSLNNLRIIGNTLAGIILSGSNISLSHSVISGNGRGIKGNNSTLFLSEASISQNSTNESGAGISFVSGSLTMDSVVVFGNDANDMGGGVYLSNSIAIITNSSVEGNTSNYGGGIYCIGSSMLTLDLVNLNENQAGDEGGGLWMGSGATLIASNSQFNQNISNQYGGGIVFNGSTDGSLSQSIVQGNTAQAGGGGIYFRNVSPILTNVLISDNEVTGTGVEYGGGGIYLYEATSDPVFINVTIANNVSATTGGGLFLYDGDPTFTNSIIYHNIPNSYNTNNGITATYNDVEGGIAGDGNINSDPLFADMNNGDYHLTDNSPCLDTGDPDLNGDGDTWDIDPDDQDPDETRMDMGVFYYHQYYTGPVWYVSTEGSDEIGDGSNESPFVTIQHAIDLSSNGDTILVEPGEYTENIYIDHGGIHIASTYLISGDTTQISSTIINGGASGSVITIDETGVDPVKLSGFVVKGGWNSEGAGIHIMNNSSAAFDHLRILDNHSFGGGGAGLTVTNYSTCIIDSSEIINNTSSADGGGFWANSNSVVQISRSLVAHNSATGIGGAFKIQDQATLQLDNLTLSSNISTGAAFFLDQADDLVITNSILDNDYDPIFYVGGSSDTIDVSYSNFCEQEIIIDADEGQTYSLILGDSNINNDPSFADPFNGNFTLLASSPCIDSGNPDLDGDGDLWGIDPDDQDPDGTRLDMGAYYYHQEPAGEFPDDLLWYSTSGTPDTDEHFLDIDATVDDALIITGYKTSTTDDSQVLLIKTDISGNIQWERYYVLQGGRGESVKQTHDGGYVITGSNLWFSTEGQMFVLKVDSIGNQEWIQLYGTGTYGYEIEQTIDHGFVVAANTEENGGRDFCLIKTDELGNEVWRQTWDSPGSDYAHSVRQTSDEGFIIGGTKSQNFNDFWLIKTDPLGGEEWNQTYGGEAQDLAYSVELGIGGGYVIAGYSNSTNIYGSDGYVVKTNDQGIEEWTYIFDESDTYGEFNDISRSDDGCYIATGYSNNNICAVKLNSQGTTVWQKSFDLGNYEQGNALYCDQNVGAILVGRTNADVDGLVLRYGGITPAIRISRPLGDSIYSVGDSVIVDWSAYSYTNLSTIELQFNSDPTSDFEIITTLSPTDSTYSFILGNYTDSARVRLIVTDSEGNIGVGQSQFFKIQYPGPVWHVSTEGSDETGDGSLESPFATIQSGITASHIGDTVLVQPGTYNENVDLLGKGIVVTSLYMFTGDTSLISQTVIQGVGNGSVIKMISCGVNPLRISGFTVTGGGGTTDGGGFFCFDSYPLIDHCKIQDNNSSSLTHGGGAHVRDCTSDTVRISHCELIGNVASYGGGGMWVENSNLWLEKSVIAENEVSIYAIKGSGIHLLNSTLLSENNTFAQNDLTGENGTSLYLKAASHVIITNTILWQNNFTPILLDNIEGDNTIEIDFSILKNGMGGINTNGGTVIWGNGNLENDPLFNDIENGNYQLQIGSPAIDAGDSESQLDPDSTRADMGAYYFDHSYFSPQISISPDSLAFTENMAEGGEQSQTLTISNSGLAPLEISIYSSQFVTDIDGNVYQTIQIGNQLWMAENLKVTQYRDGTEIPNEIDGPVWNALTTGAYCIYNNNASNEVDTYGALYNWYAVADGRNIAPEGWHVPTDDEWKELEMALGMSQSEVDATGYRGTNEGSKLAGNADLWNAGALENDSEFGSSGLLALPGGVRSSSTGNFHSMGIAGYFGSTTEQSSEGWWVREVAYNYSGVTRSGGDKETGFAVRCLSDLSDALGGNSFDNNDYIHKENRNIQNEVGPIEKSQSDNGNSWLSAIPSTLTIPPGESDEVIVTVNAEGFELGNYSDMLTILSNDPANGTIAVPVTMSVIFQDLTPPEVNLNNPDIIDPVQNGDTLNISWTASDNVGLDWAKLYFTSNGGASFGLYDSVDANLGEIDWIAPNVISNNCNFALWVSDLAGNISADTLDGHFFIDDGTIPYISIVNPTQTTSIKEYDTLHVAWEAFDNVGIEWFELWFSNNPREPFENLIQLASDDTTYSFEIDCGVSDSARVKMDVMDVAENFSSDTTDYFSITDNSPPIISHFSIPDTLEWGIGSFMDIGVIATDNVEITGLDLNYSTDGGNSWLPIVQDLYPVAGRPTYTWLIPDIPGSCRVQAVVTDAVGLTDSTNSDDFSIVIEYPQLVGFLSQIKPNMDMQLHFSQSMGSSDIATGTQVIGSVGGEYEIAGQILGDDVALSAVDGFVSLDTLMLVLSASEWTNSFGYGLDGNGNGTFEGSPEDNDTSYTMVSAAGDYDQNGLLNFDDFDDFVLAWTNDVSEYELYPHQGTVPFINIQPDSSFDVFDLATFASMWNWVAGVSLSAPLTDAFPIEEFASEQNGNLLTISLNTDGYIASQTIVKYDPELVSISVGNHNLNKVSANGLSIVNTSPDSGFIMITSSHVNGEQQESLQLQLAPTTRHLYSIEIAVQGSDEQAQVIQKRSNVDVLPIPTTFSLSQNYPNPFNASTTIEYGLPKNTDLNISIYDIRGRFVREIYSGNQLAGYHLTQWNAHNDQGQNVASGLYFIVLHTPEYRIARKALILK